jgi:hypothetical protein
MATVVDNTQSTTPADADKKVDEGEHAAGMVTINGVPQDEAQVKSVGLAEFEVDEDPKPLAEGGGKTAAPQTSTSGAGKKP